MSSVVLALSHAWQTTITDIVVWVIGFPALVTGLIVYAIVQALGEARENEAARNRRGNSA
jgi:tetrahydromethanopterin S-methyltransferase subunit E